jgi:hypothetical protein
MNKEQLISNISRGDIRLSFTSLEKFSISPKAFINYKLAKFEQTEAMLLGQLVHMMVLEPDKVSTYFVEAPEVNGATKEGKAIWHELYCQYVEQVPAEGFKMTIADIQTAITASTGVSVLSAKTFQAARLRADAILENETASDYLHGEVEVKLPEGFELFGLPFSGRADLVSFDNSFVMDIKTMADATRNNAAREIVKKKYHWQAAIYMEAFQIDSFYFICVDGNGEVSVHTISEGMKNQALAEMRVYCERFKEAVQKPELFNQSQEFYTCGVNIIDVYVKG